MSRALHSRWLSPALGMIILNLLVLTSRAGEIVFTHLANGYAALISDPLGKDDSYDWQRIVEGIVDLFEPISRTLIIACAALVAFAFVVFLRHGRERMGMRFERVFWRCTVVWAYLVVIGLGCQMYFYFFMKMEAPWRPHTWLTFLLIRLAPAPPAYLIYPGLLLLFAWLGMRKFRGRFIRMEEAAAIRQLRRESGEIPSPETPVAEEGAASRSNRWHPALGVLFVAAVILSRHYETAGLPATALMRALFGESGHLLLNLHRALYKILPWIYYAIVFAGWVPLLVSAVLLSARAFTGRGDAVSFERIFWIGVRLWAYLFLIGMYLSPISRTHGIQFLPAISLLPFSMLFFTWLGERRLRKRHAITREDAAVIPAPPEDGAQEKREDAG